MTPASAALSLQLPPRGLGKQRLLSTPRRGDGRGSRSPPPGRTGGRARSPSPWAPAAVATGTPPERLVCAGAGRAGAGCAGRGRGRRGGRWSPRCPGPARGRRPAGSLHLPSPPAPRTGSGRLHGEMSVTSARWSRRHRERSRRSARSGPRRTHRCCTRRRPVLPPGRLT